MTPDDEPVAQLHPLCTARPDATTPNTISQVLEAASALVNAFSSGNLPAYFAAFADDAVFVFHTTAQVLTSVDDYRHEWARWQQDSNFRVLSCVSSDRRVQDLGDVAVFTHRVRTRVSTNGTEMDLAERETIVFRRMSGRWLAVHEHLSPDPS